MDTAENDEGPRAGETVAGLSGPDAAPMMAKAFVLRPPGAQVSYGVGEDGDGKTGVFVSVGGVNFFIEPAYARAWVASTEATERAFPGNPALPLLLEVRGMLLEALAIIDGGAQASRALH